MNYPKINEVRTIDLLHALANVRPSLNVLKGKGKKYDPLIDAIQASFEPNPEGDIHTPDGQDFQAILGVKATKLRKWVIELYDDLLSLTLEDKAITFPKHRVRFAIYGRDDHKWFYTELPSIPRIGEEVVFPFLYPIISIAQLFVENVSYQFEGDTTEITIYATTLNPYLIQLKQRAIFENRLSRYGLHNMSNQEVEELLYKWYGRG